ncbi:site-specific integrase [Actinomadura rubteroloni]|uniref:site-specific integrase n=1 Tax=Actinomadura rubteroloni TaxID=1926885 RepID=UPI00143D59E0|nr:tyrosine-type recombinase/integrase [Actinomadura rubteroloni]
MNGYKASIYPEGKGFTGVLDLGWKADGKRNRPKRKGPTKAVVKDKLAKLAKDLDDKVTTDRSVTVLRVATEYVDELERAGKAPRTISTYRSFVKNHVSKIGAIKIKDFEPLHVSVWLVELAAKLSPETLRKVHALLTNAINRAIVYRYVNENVSLPVARPQGRKDALRESKSFSVAQTDSILKTCLSPHQRFGGYLALALTSGLRIDELNGLTWEWLDLDSDEPTVYVERAARTDGKLKTENSRRGLTLGGVSVTALKDWRGIQRAEFAARGEIVSKETPVFTRPDGSAYTAITARQEFRALLAVAGIANPAEWTLRETRTTFVSIMSHHGIAREIIADMCGHTLKTLERHYRKVLAPVHRQSASVIDAVFGQAAHALAA